MKLPVGFVFFETIVLFAVTTFLGISIFAPKKEHLILKIAFGCFLTYTFALTLSMILAH